jgi:hypothetical protein
MMTLKSIAFHDYDSYVLGFYIYIDIFDRELYRQCQCMHSNNTLTVKTSRIEQGSLNIHFWVTSIIIMSKDEMEYIYIYINARLGSQTIKDLMIFYIIFFIVLFLYKTKHITACLNKDYVYASNK